jgi:hypothetical protein
VLDIRCKAGNADKRAMGAPHSFGPPVKDIHAVLFSITENSFVADAASFKKYVRHFIPAKVRSREDPIKAPIIPRTIHPPDVSFLKPAN